ncbi:MAG: PEP-CTERM sorting domain-containing protein [Pseudomonadales bacterium]|nr:PEP-CTERM sorting domain-containing protein [Pseudomonadales bacterium]
MLKKIIIAATGFMALPAMAAMETWNFSQNHSNGTLFNEYQLDAGGVTMSATAWSSSDFGNTVEDAKLVFWGDGLGVVNDKENVNDVPDHSTDNTGNDGFDMILLEFETAVNLSHLDLSWATDDGGTNNDGAADMSVGAFTGAGTMDFASVSASKTWQEIVNLGWDTSSYNNISTSGYQAINIASYSKYWLIGAYNTAFGALNHTSFNDGVKLEGVKGTFDDEIPPPTGQVPEPGSLALFAGGLLALVLRRRSQNAKS